MFITRHKLCSNNDINNCGGFLKLILLVSLVFTLVVPAQAKANSKYAGLVINADTGEVLYQDKAGKYRYPASLTKLMTLYLTFDALKAGKLTMNQRLYVSKRAAAQPPSELGLRRGQTIRVKDAILGLIVKSANDAAVVLAESLAGTEWHFSKQMTAKAKELGMKYTTFANASGLHNRRQRTTAYDMARLATALYRDHSEYYNLFAKTKFNYRGRLVRGHNRVTRNYPGADGLKTGYTRASGFNLITSAQRSDMRIIGVVMGGKSSRSRDKHMRKILDHSFRKLAHSNRSALRVATTPVPKLKPGTKLQYAVLNDNNELPEKPDIVKKANQKVKYIVGIGSEPTPKMKKNVRFMPIPGVSPFRAYELSANEEESLIEEGGDR